ncbi:MAG: glycosyl hydrolase, partial [Sphingomonas sp.]|nr:glycosyl hydrolase [Sphingomonas sp.]
MPNIVSPWARMATAAALLMFATPGFSRETPSPPPANTAPQAVDPDDLKGLAWRNIGPFRGGRVTAVAGVPQDEHLFYMGATGGGVWKTIDGGTTWTNISDGYFHTGTIGAIAVAPSNPDILYVGTGESAVRIETFASGDGMYRSSDAGKTWTHIGLKDSRQIAGIVVDRSNPDIVFVAVQGSPWGPQDGRGVYKSGDGGKTWKLVLAGTPDTGASDLTADPKNSSVLYATMWEHRQKPWHGYQINSGGPHSGLYKSVDAGEHWMPMRKGLPTDIGRAGIAVSGTDSNRLYALVESKPGVGGLFRSDDAGASWTLINDSHVMSERSAYYTDVVADTRQRDTVYVLHAPLLKSIDGGKSFARMQQPHGDNHAMWINPAHSEWLIDGNDGGASVTYDGGKSWSTPLNQPTAQFYRVITDNAFPYNLYGGQQDNTSVKIKSRTFGDGIGIRDWYDIGGGESAHVAMDP